MDCENKYVFPDKNRYTYGCKLWERDKWGNHILYK